MILKNKKGFTVIELLVAVVIVGILSVLIVVATKSSREIARDNQRMSDIQQMHEALGLYMIDEKEYPPSIAVGEPLVGPTTGLTYMQEIPANPTPWTDGGCADSDYTYTQDNSGASYHLDFCLAEAVSGNPKGNNKLLPLGVVAGTVVVAVDYNILLLHMDGSDSGTVFTDSSSSVHTITRTNALTKTGVKFFGTASGYFDGTGDYLSIPASSDFAFGTDDFTIDFWFNPSIARSTGQGHWIVSQQTTDNQNRFQIPFYNDGSKFYITSGQFVDGTNVAPVSSEELSLSVGTWYHFAYVRNGNTGTIYKDGVSVASADISAMNVPTYTGDFIVGAACWSLGSATLSTYGYIDELRISKGVARWTTAFTPPTEAY